MSIGKPKMMQLAARPAIAVPLRVVWETLDIGALFGLHMGRVTAAAGPRSESGTPYARYYWFGPGLKLPGRGVSEADLRTEVIWQFALEGCTVGVRVGRRPCRQPV